MTAYCGTRAVAPGTVCGNGQVATWGRNFTGGPSSVAKPVPAGEDSTITGANSWMTNTSPVPLRGGTGGAYQGSTFVTEQAEIAPFNEAMGYLNEIRGKAFAPSASKNDKETYSNFVGNLRRYTDSELGTQGGIEGAWRMVLEDAQSSGVSAIELLGAGPSSIGKQTSGAGGGTGSGRGRGGYSGPTVSRTMMAESDIRATANALAIELIGRPVDDKELEKITRRMRMAEVEQPQITTSTTGSSVTQQGLTAQGREDILRDLISKNPEYQDFQVDTTVLDAMTGFINEKKQVSGG
jgi:hypothetical protein